jgi:multiple antibiotic resistance protein
MNARELIATTLYFVALINPISKIALLVLFPAAHERHEVPKLAIRATIIATAILLTFEFGGDFMLRNVFHVELYSLRIAGGIVIFITGLKALTRGVFFDADVHDRYSEAAIVPLASPMIAGPATITAVVASASERGHFATVLPLLIAVAVNLVFMLLAVPIGDYLRRHNIIGAIIRLTGLVVATMGTQMALMGAAAWWKVASGIL